MLAFEHASRLSFVQHNFLEGLPFDGARFNYVRVSGVAIGMPGAHPPSFARYPVFLLSPPELISLSSLPCQNTNGKI